MFSGCRLYIFQGMTQPLYLNACRIEIAEVLIVPIKSPKTSPGPFPRLVAFSKNPDIHQSYLCPRPMLL
jgi:hypothetical protein